MRLVISTPTGYNAREILLPLHRCLEDDPSISSVSVITPAAEHRSEFFSNFGTKFEFILNPPNQTGHDKLLRKIQPDLVLTPTIGLDVLDTPILHAAKHNNIPTLTFVASWDNVFKMDRLRARGHSGSSKGMPGDFELPDHFAVWNEMNKKHILSSFTTINNDQVTITGPPRFDYFSHHDSIPSKSELLDYLGFSDSSDLHKLIHGATTELYPFNYILKAISTASQQGSISSPLHLYASVHPGGDINNHQYKKYGGVTKYSFGRRDHSPISQFSYLPSDKEIYMLVALFKHTDVLINQSSTVAIESMLADVPVINVKYGRPLDWLKWRRSMVYRDFKQHYRYITDASATTIVHNKTQLIQSINEYIDTPSLKQKERQFTINKMISFTDGSSSNRLLNLLKSIVTT